MSFQVGFNSQSLVALGFHLNILLGFKQSFCCGCIAEMWNDWTIIIFVKSCDF